MSYRPGLGAPSAEGGQARYDTGKKGGETWQENDNKGDQAKIYDSTGEWIGEWVGGRIQSTSTEPEKIKKRTQWMAGNGDGLLVWDHNGNGIIDDNTELMSEFDKDGKTAFANGFEKLAHYFDLDGDGVITAQEWKGLMLWVDDGDAITEAGELRELSDYGITGLIVPKRQETYAGEFLKETTKEVTETGEAYREALEQEPEPPIPEPPKVDVHGTIELSSRAKIRTDLGKLEKDNPVLKETEEAIKAKQKIEKEPSKQKEKSSKICKTSRKGLGRIWAPVFPRSKICSTSATLNRTT